MSNGNGNGVKLTEWAKGLIGTAVVGAFSLWGVWSVARADVDTLKKDVADLKPLAASVAVLQNSLTRVESRQNEMSGDLKEVQRDIKTILQLQRSQ